MSKEKKEKKRAYGAGTAYEKNGKWYAQKMIDGKRRTVSGKSEREVRKKLDELAIELADKDLQKQKKEEAKEEEIKKNGQETLKNWIKRWVVNSKGDLKDQRSINCVVRRICRLRIANLQLQDITPEDVQGFINQMRKEKKYSDRTMEYTYQVLNECLYCALDYKYITDNPCRVKSIKKPHVKKSQLQLSEDKYWTKEEVAKFVETYMDKHILFPFYYLMILTGLRKQEAAALHWDDINWKEKTLRIDTAIVVPPNCKGEIEDVTKTPGSNGIIHISDEAIDVLKKQRKYQMEQSLKYKFKNEDNWIFTSMYGKHYSLSWLSQQFKKLCEDANLKNITVHGLRHTTATLLLDSGCTLEEVSKLLRHVNILVTTNYYAHLTKDKKQKTANVTQNVVVEIKDIIKKKNAPEQMSEAN